MFSTPPETSLAGLIAEMRAWDFDPGSAPLHVGDLGWTNSSGPPRWRPRCGCGGSTATSPRSASSTNPISCGSPSRPLVPRPREPAPRLRHQEAFIRELVADLAPEAGVLPPGAVALEARFDGPLHDLLLNQGWAYDEAWTPLVRDLSHDVPAHHLRIEDVDPGRLPDRLAVHHAAFGRTTFTSERWRALTEGPAYAHARSLVGYDDQDRPVAMVTVWAGRYGGPGELEPMGVHSDHHGRGHGRAICLAAAAALQEIGASHAFVSTPSSNTAAVATYRAAGYDEKAQVRDLRRPA